MHLILYRQLRERVQEGLVFCSGEKDLAYSICAVGRETGYILISLLAVFDGFRGQGIGSAFIDEIRLKYKNKRAIIDFRQFIENTKI